GRRWPAASSTGKTRRSSTRKASPPRTKVPRPPHRRDPPPARRRVHPAAPPLAPRPTPIPPAPPRPAAPARNNYSSTSRLTGDRRSHAPHGNCAPRAAGAGSPVGRLWKNRRFTSEKSSARILPEPLMSEKRLYLASPDPGAVVVVKNLRFTAEKSSARTAPLLFASPARTFTRNAKSPPGDPSPLGKASAPSDHSPSSRRPRAVMPDAESASSRMTTLSASIGTESSHIAMS